MRFFVSRRTEGHVGRTYGILVSRFPRDTHEFPNVEGRKDCEEDDTEEENAEKARYHCEAFPPGVQDRDGSVPAS